MDLETVRLLALDEVLGLIEVNAHYKSIFDPNYPLDVLTRMKHDEEMRKFHIRVQFFIIQHMPYPKSKIPETDLEWNEAFDSKQTSEAKDFVKEFDMDEAMRGDKEEAKEPL